MGRAVGIELTEANVKILSLEQNGKRPRIVQFHKAPIPGAPEIPWEERAAQTLREALAESKVPRGRVVVSLDSGDAILREVTLPFKNEDQIRKTVRFELESLVHNYTIEELVVSHYKTGETDKATHLLAAAVPKEIIRNRLKVLQAAGIDPVALDLDVAAVFNAMHHAGAIDTDEPHLLIYGTTKFTKLVFIEQRQPRSIRTIRFSMPTPAPAAARSIDLPTPPPEIPGRPTPIVIVTEEESRRFADLDRDEQGALVEILAKEISRFLLANAASASPAHILLSGDLEDENAARMIQGATQIPVKTFNLLNVFEHPFGEAAAETSSKLGATLGLALKGAGMDALGMDFRQEEFQYRRRYETLKTTALVTLELVIVFLAAVALHLWFKHKELRRDTARVHEAHLDLYETARDAKDEPLTDGALAYDKLDEIYRRYRGVSGAELPIKTSAREAWRELFRGIAEFQRKYAAQPLGDGTIFLEMENIDVQQSTTPGNESGSVTLRGKITNLEFFNALRTELRAIELLKTMDLVGQLTQLPDGKTSFQLRAAWGKVK